MTEQKENSIAKGKIENWDWDKQSETKKEVCAICRENEGLMKITGEQSLCHLCGNEVVICRRCVLTHMKDDLKKTIKQKQKDSPEQKILDALEQMDDNETVRIDLNELVNDGKTKVKGK